MPILTNPSTFPPIPLTRIAAIAVASLVLPSQSFAASILVEVTASYQEMRGRASTPDAFTITNAGEGSIAELQLDLSGSAGAVFDPGGAPFTVTSVDDVGLDVGVGFELTGDDLLRLVFTGFDPTESFSFGVDVDDSSGYTTGADFAGAVLTVTLAGYNDLTIGVFTIDGSDPNRANASVQQMIINPEPSTILMLAFGLAALAARRRTAP